MSALEDYLLACRTRLRRRFVARGAAIIAFCALAATGLFALVFVTWVPASGFVLTTQIILYGTLAAGIGVLIWWPMSNDVVTRHVEARVASFDGRLQTWWDATRRGDDSAMLALLTQETKSLAESNSHTQVVAAREYAAPASTAGIILVALAWLLLSGNNAWQLAAKRLWTGDLLTAAAPRITLDPGDIVVPRGTDVVIEAQVSGFVAQQMAMNAAFENTDGWEKAPMARLGEDKYGFVFVGVTEQVDYYVTAAGLNSQRHVIHVADLPRVTSVSLEYDFPDWTGLPVAERDDGDISALPDTKVAITAATDLPVEDPVIVVNGIALDASASGLETHGSFTVSEEGSWHVAVRHEGTLARISDTYLINIVADAPPEVAFSWPGHDGQATAIEEVALRFRAEDDYGIESLVLNYSVNGGAWVDVALENAEDEDEAGHLLYLEDLTVTSKANDDAETQQRPLKPGDMITFFAEAKDHRQQVRTALYFVDVRPFDRTYRERQSEGGGGGGGNTGFEIADRQRDIVTATWNLLNKQTNDNTTSSAEDESTARDAMKDQTDVLAILQRTLKDQVYTLTGRAQARRLNADDEINVYITELGLAAEYMEPAAEKLDASELLEAITPEQHALQHLLAAEASMTDVDVARGSANSRGTSGRSLSELFDLEMDPERNRYETPQTPNFGENAEQDDSEWRRLEELASRQEQLADRQRSGEESLTSRWQQERLQRQIEELQRELEASQSQQNQGAISNAISQLNQARQAIERSLQQPSGDPSSARQASQAMLEAAQQLRQNERSNLQERLERSGERVDNLLADQRNTFERLERLERETLEASRRGETIPYRDFTMEPYVERKQRMQEDLNDISQELSAIGDTVAESDPDTERILQRAVDELTTERIDEHLTAAADAFAMGRPLYAIRNEAIVEGALERLADSVQQAQQQLARGSAGQGRNDSPLARVRELRQSLADARGGAGGAVYDGDRLDGILRATDALEYALRRELGDTLSLDTTLSRLNYIPRGTDDDNTEALARLTRDRLDLIETTLLNLDAPSIRAQQPRDIARDSAEAARYFRSLSAPDG